LSCKKEQKLGTLRIQGLEGGTIVWVIILHGAAGLVDQIGAKVRCYQPTLPSKRGGAERCAFRRNRGESGSIMVMTGTLYGTASFFQCLGENGIGVNKNVNWGGSRMSKNNKGGALSLTPPS